MALRIEETFKSLAWAIFLVAAPTGAAIITLAHNQIPFDRSSVLVNIMSVRNKRFWPYLGFSIHW